MTVLDHMQVMQQLPGPKQKKATRFDSQAEECLLKSSCCYTPASESASAAAVCDMSPDQGEPVLVAADVQQLHESK